jgi:hypothetical protein
MKEQLPLAAADIKKLKHQLIPMIIFPFVVVGMFALFAVFVFKNIGNSFANDDTGIIMLAVFGTFFFGVIAYMIWSAAIDLKRGFKYRITGKVTDKRLNVHTTTTAGSTSSRGSVGGRTRTTRHYYLYIDHAEYSVDYKEYSRTKVGSQVIMDKAPKSNLTLNLEVVEQENIDLEVDRQLKADNRKFLESRIQEVRFTEKDLDALKKKFNAEKRRRFMFMAPLLFFDAMLLVYGFWSFLVVLFPLILVPLYQFYKIFRSYLRYRNNKFYGYKLGLTALVEDKLTFTSNRSGNANRIKTTWGTVNVDSRLYDQLSVGDKIIIFTTKEGRLPMSVMTLDKEEFYLS